jgi:5-methylcytosine-specific restriction endonuclease McrA
MSIKQTLLQRQQAMRERVHESRTKASGVPSVRKEVDTKEANNLHLPSLQKSKVERAQAIQYKIEGKTYREIGELIGKSRQYAQQLCRPRFNLRDTIIERCEDCCEDCFEPQNQSGHFHHITTKGQTAETYSAIDNIAYLCTSCHIQRHGPDPEIIRIKIPVSDEEFTKIERRAGCYRLSISGFVRMKLGMGEIK